MCGEQVLRERRGKAMGAVTWVYSRREVTPRRFAVMGCEVEED